MNTLRIDMLEPEEALALLANRLDRPLTANELGTEKQPGPTVELAARLGRHPLALEVAGALLARKRYTWTALLAPLRQRQGDSLATLELSADDRLASLHACFDLSVAALTENQARLYRRLGVLAPDGPFTVEDAVALWDDPSGAATVNLGDLLHDLVDHALLDQTQSPIPGHQSLFPTHFRQHILLREDALQRLRRAGGLDDALQCHAEHYVGVAAARDRHEIAHSHRQMESVLRRAWMDGEDAIDEGLSYPVDTALRRLNSLVFDCHNAYWDFAGLYAYRLLCLPRAAAACRSAGDRRNGGAHLGNLGLAYAALGRVEEAIEQYEQALAISREIGDRRGEGNHLGNLGSAYFSLG